MAVICCEMALQLLPLLFFMIQFSRAYEPFEDMAHALDTYPLPTMNYSYDSLEPFLDEKTMTVHHTGHHAAYTSKMNQALKEWKASVELGFDRNPGKRMLVDIFNRYMIYSHRLERIEYERASLLLKQSLVFHLHAGKSHSWDCSVSTCFGTHKGFRFIASGGWKGLKPNLVSQSILKILQKPDEVPEQWRRSIRNNGGGYVNHAFYFAIMGPNPNKEERFPSRITAQYIDTSFGNFSKFKEIFVKEATQLFGSGYVWLCREPKKDYFTIISTLNQQSPVSFGLEPVLVLDVWEHAYYLKHQNKRAGYIKDWWNIVDWKKVEKLLIWWKWQSERQHIEL